MRIIFFGTPSFAAHILEYVISQKIEMVALVCQPDRMQENRSPIIPPVKKSAEKYLPHVPVLQPLKASDPEFLDKLERFQADLFVVAAYGQILKKRLLDMPKMGCINVHGSLLPKYRGAAPIQRALMNGETITGITIMKMEEKMDAGEMIRKKSVSIPIEMTYGELEKVLYEIAGPLLLEVIKDYEKGTISSEKQDESLVSYAPKILPEDCVICWDKSANEVHNQIRALCPTPGAYSFFSLDGEKKRIKILKTLPIKKETVFQTITYPSKDRLVIGCKEDCLEIFSLQPEGKAVMDTSAFLRGLGKKSFYLLSVS